MTFIAYRYPSIGSGEWESFTKNWDVFKPEKHVYSRYTVATSTRVEKILGDIHVRIILPFKNRLIYYVRKDMHSSILLGCPLGSP